MNALILLLTGICFWNLSGVEMEGNSAAALIPEETHLQAIDPCNMYGKVFISKSRYNAQYVVYVEKEEGMADLVVFKEESKLMADEPGVWYFTDSEHFADYRIYITSDRRMADFSIEYVEERAFAGCP